MEYTPWDQEIDLRSYRVGEVRSYTLTRFQSKDSAAASPSGCPLSQFPDSIQLFRRIPAHRVSNIIVRPC